MNRIILTIFTLCVLLTGCGPKNDPVQYWSEKAGGSSGTCGVFHYTNNIMQLYTKYPIIKLSGLDSHNPLFLYLDLKACAYYMNTKNIMIAFFGIVSNTNYYTMLSSNRIAHIYLSNAQYRTNILKQFDLNSWFILISANSSYAHFYYYNVPTQESFYPVYSTTDWTIVNTNSPTNYPPALFIFESGTNNASIYSLIFDNYNANSFVSVYNQSTNIVTNIYGVFGISRKNRYIFYTKLEYGEIDLDEMITFSIDKWPGTAYIYDRLLNTNYCLVDFTFIENAENGIGSWTTSVTNHWIDEYFYSNNIIYKTNWRSNVIIDTVRTSNFILCDSWLYENRKYKKYYLYATRDVPIGFSEDLKYYYFVILTRTFPGDLMADGQVVSNVTGLYRMDISALNLNE